MKLRALAFSLILVVSMLGGSIALAGTATAAPGGMVGVPDANIQDVRADAGPLDAAELTVYTDGHAETTEVSIVTESQADKVAQGTPLPDVANEKVCDTPAAEKNPNVDCEEDTTPSLVFSDDTHHEGRTLAVESDTLEKALGEIPGFVTIRNSETGEEWRQPTREEDGWVFIEAPHFSDNAVTWGGSVQIGDSFTSGSTVQYDIQDLDSASDVTVNLTGKTSTEWDNVSASGVPPDTTDSLSVGGNLSPTDGSGGDPLLSVTGHLNTWDIGSTSYTKSFDANSESSSTNGVQFSKDGLTMYVAGESSDNIYQYSLSTAWDVDTASYDKSFDVSPRDTGLVGFDFSDDGTVMYVSGDSNANIYQYSLSTAWDVGSASYTKEFDTSAETSYPEGVELSSDGKSMYVPVSGTIYQYSLSTAWDVGSASFDKSLDVSLSDDYATGVTFSDDGTTMLFSGNTNDNIYEYSLSTAWDLGSSTHVDTFDLSPQTTTPMGVTFSDGGTVMYVAGSSQNIIYQYSVASPISSLSVSDGDGHSASFGDFNDGETKERRITLSNSSTELNFVATGGESIDYSLTMQERSGTENPGVELNDGNYANHTGTLADGESVQYTIDKSTLQTGTNTINVSMADTLSADAPAMQVQLDYSHDAQDRQTVSYDGTKFHERYNVSKQYSSDRTNPELVIPFDNTVAKIDSVEYRVNGGSWQSTTDHVLSGTEATIHLPDATAGDTMTVRANASRVAVSNGAITVEEPTNVGERLDSKFVVDSYDSRGDLEFALGDSLDASKAHYVYNATWTPDEYNEYDSSGSHSLVMPGAEAADTARISTIPVSVEPKTNEVRVEIADPKTTEPTFKVRPGASTGDEVAFTYESAADDTDYILYSQTRGVVVDSGTANSPLTLIGDDSEETLQFQIDDGTADSTDGDSGGILGPLPDGPQPAGTVVDIDLPGSTWLGIIVLGGLGLLGIIYWRRGEDEAAEVATETGRGTASVLTGTARWIGGALASTAQWLAAHPYISGSLAAAGVLGLFATGTLSLPQGAGVMLLVAGTPLVSWTLMRRWGDQSLVVWGGTTLAAIIVGLQLLGTDLFALIFDSQAGVIAMIGLIGLAYYALKTYRAEATTPEEQNTIVFETDGGEGGNGGGA